MKLEIQASPFNTTKERLLHKNVWQEMEILFDLTKIRFSVSMKRRCFNWEIL